MMKWFAMAVFAVGLPQPAGATDYYTMHVEHSRKCAHVQAGWQQNGANIMQWTCGRQAYFLWERVDAGGYVYLRNKNSGKCAQVDRASHDNGANISQWDCLNQTNVQWRLVWAEGFGYIVNRESGNVCTFTAGQLTTARTSPNWIASTKRTYNGTLARLIPDRNCLELDGSG